MRLSLISQSSSKSPAQIVHPTNLQVGDLAWIRRIATGKILVDRSDAIFLESYGRRQLKELSDLRITHLYHILDPLMFCTLLLAVKRKDPLYEKRNTLANQMRYLENCEWWIRVMTEEEKPQEDETTLCMNLDGEMELTSGPVLTPFDAQNTLDLLVGCQQFSSPIRLSTDPAPEPQFEPVPDDAEIIEFSDGGRLFSDEEIEICLDQPLEIPADDLYMAQYWADLFVPDAQAVVEEYLLRRKE